MFKNNIFSQEVGAEKREKLVPLEFWPNGLLMPNNCKLTTHKKLEQAPLFSSSSNLMISTNILKQSFSSFWRNLSS